MNTPASLYLDKQQRLEPLQPPYCDILIITVIDDLEEKSLIQHLSVAGAKRVEPTDDELDNNLKRWRLPSLRDSGYEIEILTKCLDNAGNGNAGIEVLHLLYRSCCPTLVAFCGIGGSLDVQEAQLGNVLVGSTFQWRGYDKLSQGGNSALEMRKKVIFNHNPSELFINHLKAFALENANAELAMAEGLLIEINGQQLGQALAAWKAKIEIQSKDLDKGLSKDLEDLHSFDHLDYATKRVPKVKFGGIMSWDYVLNSRDLREELRADNKIFKAVDMESGGITRAIRKAQDYLGNEIEFLAVRGISDLCSNKSDDLFRHIAADHAAAFLVGFLHHRFSPTMFV